MEYKIKTSDIINIIKEAEQSIEYKEINYFMCNQLKFAVERRFNEEISEIVNYYLCALLRERYYPYNTNSAFIYCIVEGIQRDLFIYDEGVEQRVSSPEYIAIKKLTLNDFAKYFEWRLSTGEEYIIITEE